VWRRRRRTQLRRVRALTIEATSGRACARRMVVRQASEKLSGAAAALRELSVHEQFRARSQVRAARPAHLECAIRLQCEHSMAPFFAGSRHTRQLTARDDQCSGKVKLWQGENVRLLRVVLTRVCSRTSKRSASVCGASGGTGDALPVKDR
jgi:hypothetical protein